MEDLAFKLFRFCIVGTLGMGIDFGITWLCKERAKWHKYVANGTGFACAVGFNYLLNRVWTFQSHGEPGTEFALFVVASVLGLGINTFFLWLGNSRMHFPFYLSKLIATGITVIWNFGFNYCITFEE